MWTKVFDGPAIDLVELMQARETRRLHHESLLRQYPGACLVSITLNTPGPVKDSAVLRQFFSQQVATFLAGLNLPILDQVKLEAISGPETYLVLDQDPLKVKARTLEFEQASPAGRLLDMDVLVLNQDIAQPISRSDIGQNRRTCFLCGQDAKACARQQQHDLQDLRHYMAQVILQTLT